MQNKCLSSKYQNISYCHSQEAAIFGSCSRLMLLVPRDCPDKTWYWGLETKTWRNAALWTVSDVWPVKSWPRRIYVLYSCRLWCVVVIFSCCRVFEMPRVKYVRWSQNSVLKCEWSVPRPLPGLGSCQVSSPSPSRLQSQLHVRRGQEIQGEADLTIWPPRQ